MSPAKPFPIYQLMDAFEAFSHGEPLAKPQHRSLYYYLLGRARKLGNLPTYTLPYEHGMHGSGIGSWATYDAALKALAEWGFIVYTPGANRFKTPVVAIQFRNPTDDVLLTYWQSYCLSTSNPTDNPTGDNNRLTELGNERLNEVLTQLRILEGEKTANVAALAALQLEKDFLIERLEKASKEFRALRLENDELKAAKPTTPALTAKPKKRTPQHAFADSPYADLQNVIDKLKGGVYELADAAYYHETIRNWAESKGEQKADWLGTIRNAMLRDSKENKLKTALGSSQVPYAGAKVNDQTNQPQRAPLLAVPQRQPMLDPETDRLRAFSEEQATQAAPTMVYRSTPNRPAQIQPTTQAN